MFDASKEHKESGGKLTKFYSNDINKAILDEDMECLEGVLRKYGSTFLNQIQKGSPRDIIQKGLGILPLHLAASYRKLKSMQKLLSVGADPEMRDQFGRTTLHLVIVCWPSIQTSLPKPGSKFLTAVISSHRQAEACLQLLCEHGVDVNAEVEGEHHQTALHLAVRYTAQSSVHILASYGANVNAVDSSGMTPLHMAAGMLHKDLITSLIKSGADINMAVKPSGSTPLHLAVVAMAMKTTKTLEHDISCVSKLLEQGAVVNAVQNAGLTPLQEACSMGSEELVDLLLRHGANVNMLSNAGENCLFLFLNRRLNVRNNTLLVKLLSLTSSLTIYNHSGHLPSTLMLPRFFKQRDQLLKLSQQPRRLQDICKIVIHLQYIQGKREEVRKHLPKKLYDFVYNSWDNVHNISFETDDKQDLFNYHFGITPS